MSGRIRICYKSIIMYIIFVFMMVAVISCKKNYFIDETFSYGLANYISEDGKNYSMAPKLAPYTYSPAGEAYYEYLTVQIDDEFDLEHIWENQANDVHPPLYYLIVYLFSYLLKGHFTKWIAGIINIVFMVMTLAAIRKLLGELGSKEKEIWLISLFVVFCPGLLSAVSLFRMYIMAMCEITWLTYLLIKCKKEEDSRTYCFLFLLCVVGALTHYYFLIYLFFISVFFCLSLILNQRLVSVLKYVICMICAGFCSYITFPKMIHHIFGGESRGGESFSNLQKSYGVWWNNIKDFWRIIDVQLFGNCLLLILVIVIFYAIRKCFVKHTAEQRVFRMCSSDYFLLIMPSICYFLLVSKIAVYNVDRYMVPVYAVLIVWILHGIGMLIDKFAGVNRVISRWAFCILIAVMLFNGWKKCGWPYLYLDSEMIFEEIKPYGHLDCLYVYGDGRYRIQANFLEVNNFQSITFFEKNVDALSQMNQLRTKSNYILYIQENMDGEEIISQIEKYCPQINAYEKIDSYGSAVAYYLY